MTLTTGRRLRRAGLCLAVAMVVLPGARSAFAACDLVPVVHQTMVNQGLPYDQAGTSLVRGKDAVARVYLSLPSCATPSDQIAVTGGTLDVLNGASVIGAGVLYSPVKPAAIQAYYVAMPPPSPDHPGDPMFTVAGSVLTPCGGPCADSSAFTATFRIAITYRVNGVAPDQTLQVSQSTQIAKKSNALRLLVVPMGDATQPYRTQFSPDAEAATRQAMSTLARIAPVPGSVGELCPPPPGGSGCGQTQGGVRYHLDLAAMVNLKDPSMGLNSYSGTPPKFCGGGSSFDGIKRQLAAFLMVWNAGHDATHQADVALGVVDEAISNSGACVDGMGAVNDKEAWVRVVTDKPGLPSRTGATVAMEVAHTFGVVRNSPTYHSPRTRATDTTTSSRAYNVDQRRYIANEHTVMNWSDQDSPWNNDTTFLEATDQGDSLCMLNGPTTLRCPAPSVPVGTTDNVNASPKIVVSGLTDGTAAGTTITESFVTAGIPFTASDDTSPYRLVQTGTAGRVVAGVPAAGSSSAHAGQSQTSPPGKTVIEFALTDGVAADNFALYYCAPTQPADCKDHPEQYPGTFLYGRQHQAVTPAITGSQALRAGAPVDFSKGDATTIDVDPSFSPDAGWVAFNRLHSPNSTYEVAHVASGSAFSTVDSATGATIDACTPTGGTPSALTAAAGARTMYWTNTTFTGSVAVGDGLIHLTTSACLDLGTLPFADGPGGAIQDDVGAIAVAPSGQLWVAGYDYQWTGTQWGQYLYHLSSNGSLIDSCWVTPNSTNILEGGNDSLAFLSAGGLGGSGDYLVTDAADASAVTPEVYLLDTANCTGGAQITPTQTAPLAYAMDAIWAGPNGHLWVSNGSLTDRGAWPFDAAGTPAALPAGALGLSIDTQRSEIVVGPAGNVDGGGIADVPGQEDALAFCPNGDLVFASSTGDVYATHPDLTTTPPAIPQPHRIYDADPGAAPSRPPAAQVACLSDGRLVIAPDSLAASPALVLFDPANGATSTVPQPAGECGVDPAASPANGDPRIAYRFYSCANPGLSLGGIALVNVDSGARSALLADSGAQRPLSPAFGDGGRIAYRVANANGNLDVHTIASAGGDDRLIATDTPPVSGTQIAYRAQRVAYLNVTPSGVRDVNVISTAVDGAVFGAAGTDPEDFRADFVYQCANGVVEPVAAGVPPASIVNGEARFPATFDTSAACGGGTGHLSVLVTDGFTRVASAPADDVTQTSSPKDPAASIASPPDGATFSTTAKIPLYGGGFDAEDGQTGSISWTVAGQGAAPGERVDASPPPGGWQPGPQTVTLTVRDGSNAAAVATRSITIVDDAAPAIALAHSVNGSNGWNVTAPVSVAVTASDDGTGLASISCTAGGSPASPSPALVAGSHSYSGTLSVSGDGTKSVSCSALDGAGLSAPAADTVKIDTSVPSVTITTPPANVTYLLHESVTASYSCTDAGSGLTSCSGTVANGSPVDTATAGAKTFTVTATDAAGNMRTIANSYQVIDDQTPPVVTATHSIDGTNGWNKTSTVSVTVSASDSGAGLSSISCTLDGNHVTPSPALTAGAPVYTGGVTASGAGSHTVVCTASDRAGNTGQSTPDVVKIDATPPSVTITSPALNATYLQGATVNAAYSCADGGSGLATCSGPVPSGSPIDLSTAGTKTFDVTGRDAAGNTTLARTTFTVVPRCSSLVSLDTVYTTHPLLILGPLKITANAPAVEGTLALAAPGCSTLTYRLHVLSAGGVSELKRQDVAGNGSSSSVAFSIDMGNGAAGQFLDPSSVCVYVQSLASNGAQYDRIPATGCATLNEDSPSTHLTH